MEKNFSQNSLSKTSKFYSAIYEFAQGSYPNIGNLIGVDKNNFFLAVVNTPTDFELSTLRSPPTIICSFFQNIQYIALYIQILDVHARGFTRPIVLVFAYNGETRNGNIMESLMCLHRNEFLALAEAFQKKANDMFPSELKKYALQFQYVLNHFSEKYPTLPSKFEELKSILPLVGITDLENVEFEESEIDPKSFININNNLRPIEQMIDLDTNQNKVIEFIKMLPTSQLQATVVDGLGFNADYFIQTFESDHSMDSFCLSKLVSRKDIIFSLLCGITLVIIVPPTKYKEAEQFARKLSILTPLDRPLKKEYIQKVESVSEILKNDIIITHSCSVFISKQPFAYLNLENTPETFETPLCCPNNSFVFRFISSTENAQNVNENIFLIAAFNRIKHAYSKFLIKIAEISERTRQTRERMLAALKSFGFSPDDEPIFRHWMYSMASKVSFSPNVKTIILNSQL